MAKENPTLKDITKAWLVANGFDGLFGDQCGCKIDDLMPCMDWLSDDCRAGYKVNYSDCECPCGEGCTWHVQETKEKIKSA